MTDKKTEQPTMPSHLTGGSAGHRPAHNIKIGVETEGMDEAIAKIEGLADALDAFPAQVLIKGAKNCAFNIYPSQVRQEIKEVEKDEPEQLGI